MPETVVAAPTLDRAALIQKLEASRAAARVLSTVTTAQKNRALHAIGAAVLRNADRILPASSTLRTRARTV
jgi:glutamate-5-semialdehyde dehydrogenase